MLDTTTKRNIDSARNILVGKVPDPKAQVEQITTALIYKFMDDMDLENEEAGLSSQFFVEDYAKYSWRKLMDNRLSGQERMDLYVEAVANIPKSKNIPQLFRDIFKGAFLPFRDPRTLSLFLKEINEFNYDHSENLGNAFEYLLSILGSQGDAGQFRTPRHIIDFIVEVVNPQKNETILDPACGTAGFLISAYKHILKTNSSNFKPEEEKAEDKIIQGETATETIITDKINYSGDLLSPDDKTKLTHNIAGYDISPDMVKLALVNLYLHGFSDPKVFEYDTLSSDKRWDENFDVVLANPPFMTPKGGIVPHKRFSIKANRAEVLFVDYIAEHLSIKGRAGIIVPEGIIFQSANAYKNLRKNLIENWGLYAVVSLPSGVFQPYAGVKTSVLLMDREFAKKTNEILFLKIENDGFDLGAQRRKIDKNDLPDVLEVLNKWKKNPSSPLDKGDLGGLSFVVPKEKIAENGEYNLTGDRYRETVDYSNVKWEMVELGEVCEIQRGTSITKKDLIDGDIPVIAGGQQPAYYHNQSNRTGKTITVSGSGAYAGFVNYFEIPIFSSDSSTIQSLDEKKLLTNFVFYLLKEKQDEVYKLQSGMGQPHVYAKDLKQIQIPLPPLEVQEQIVAEIEQYQKVIDGAKQVVAHWKPSFRIDTSWDMVELGGIIQTITPPNKIQKGDYKNSGKYPIIDQSQDEIAGYSDDENSLITAEKDLVVFGDHTCNIKYVDFPFVQGADGIKILKTNDNLLPKFLYYSLKTKPLESDGYKRHFTKLKLYKIPLPPLEVQEQIVAEIEAEQKAIEECKKLIEKMEKKIEAKIEEVWGEEI